MYIDKQGHKFRNIFLVLKGDDFNKHYLPGWYYEDECQSDLYGPFESLTEARRELRLYGQRLSQKKFDYDTFSNSRIYKTLPYIMDRVNEMDTYKQAQVSKYFNTLNKVCNDLSSIKQSKEKLFDIAKIINNNKKLFNFDNDISYYQTLIIVDFINKIDFQFNKYDPKFVSYLKNFTKAKIRKLW